VEIAESHTLIYVKFELLDRLPTFLSIILFFLKINEILYKNVNSVTSYYPVQNVTIKKLVMPNNIRC
jgi:hypothetical protein